MVEPSASSSSEAPRLPVRLLGAIALSTALGPLNSTMVAVALPEMARTLAADSGVLRQALVSSYLLTNVVLQSPGGKLGDRLGYRRALGLGQLLLAIGASLAYIWPVLPVLSLGRVIMAAGGAILAPSAIALLRTELPVELRGRAFGAFGAIMGLSAGLGPTLGAVLVGRFGWSSIFLVNVPVLLLSATLAHADAPKRTTTAIPAAPQARFDILGSVLLGASLVGISVGLETSHLRWVAVVGALGLVPFALWERRVADPVIDFSLFKQRAFLGGSLIIAVQNFAMYATIFELPQVAGRLFHLGPRDVGSILLAMMGTMVLMAPIAGRLSDRFGARSIAVLGCLLALGGMIFLAVRPWTAIADVVPGLLMLGAGMGLTSAPTQSAAMSDVPREKSGMAAGITSTMRYVGGIAGLTVLGLVLTDRPEKDVIMHEHTIATSIFCVALFLTTCFAFVLPARVVPAANARGV